MSKLELVEKLRSGIPILRYSEGGNSMVPLIHSREPVDIYPVDVEKVEKGDILFCKVNGRFFLHKVTALKDGMVQIGNNHGYINGWTSKNNIFGIVACVDGREISKAADKILHFQKE